MTKTNKDIKYCVTSFTDLSGFSSHLEIGNDLRTKIGQEAINRLRILENTIEQFLSEKKKYSKYYPANLKYQRINDSLILTLDLPDFLTPSIGENVKNGITANEIAEQFSEKEMETYETFDKAYKDKLTQSIIELTQFIGLVSRIHSYINRKENESFFPGAKTVVSSGYRKSFITKSNQEDYFSANFSFSNAYLAALQLKGEKLFIDNYILQMLGSNQLTKNILKIASLVYERYKFDPLDDNENILDNPSKYRKGDSFEIDLFRKKYVFRELNPTPISFLQLFPALLPYLSGQKKLKISRHKKNLFTTIIDNFEKSRTTLELSACRNKLFFFRFDIEDNIEIAKELILTGKSSVMENQRKTELKMDFLRLTKTK